MDSLTSITSLLLLAVLIIFFILIWINKDKIKAPFEKIKRKTWVILLLIILTSFALRFFLVEHMHNLYYDELGYLDIAKHLANEGEKCLCMHNINGECLVCNYSLKSIGFTALLAALIKIFGLSASVGFNMIAIIGSLSIALTFLFTYLLFQKENISLFSALMLAFHPLHLRWSGSLSSEIVSLFFIMLTFTCLLLYIKSKIPILISTLLILFFTLSVREENLIILPFFAIPFIAKKEYRKKFLVITGLTALIAIPSIIGIYIAGKGTSSAIGYTFWKQGSLLSITFLKKYFLTNMAFFLNANYTSHIIIALTIIGLIFLFKEKKALALTLLIGMIIIPTIFSAYTGQALTGSEVRHYIPGLMIVAVLSGYAISFFEKFSLLRKIKISFIVSLLVVISLIFYLPYLTSKDSPYTPPQKDYEFAVKSLSKIPKGCIIITQEPYIFDLHDRSATSIHIQNLYLNNECMYYYEGESCYRLGLYETCNDIADALNLEPYLTNGRHSFFKIKDKEVLLNF